MKKIKDLVRFTKYEKKVLVFLTVTSILAVALNIWNNSEAAEYKNYEYSEIDSLFNEAETLKPAENNEKNVDSKHELLDLRVSDNKYKNNKSKLLADKSININTADKNTLIKLPGIGNKTADAIIAYRKKHGNFSKISDLKKIKGIGSKKFKKIEKYINLK